MGLKMCELFSSASGRRLCQWFGVFSGFRVLGIFVVVVVIVVVVVFGNTVLSGWMAVFL